MYSDEVARALTDITYLGFNQDGTCLAAAHRRGFAIFSTETGNALYREDCGATRIVEMLFRTSLVALVGLADEPKELLSSCQLTMWNTKSRSCLCQRHFDAEICGMKMNHRRVIVLLRNSIHIFELRTMRLLHVLDRAVPAPGLDPALAALCCDPERGLLAAPLAAGNAGAVPSFAAGVIGLVDTHTLRPLGSMLAHRSPVRALALNPSGHLLATASRTGTVVRLWAVPSLVLLCSFRRGTSECRVHGLSFATDSLHLSAAVSSGMVHVFRCPEEATCRVPRTSVTDIVAAAGISQPRSRETKVEDASDAIDDFSEWNIVEEDPGRVAEAHISFGADGLARKTASLIKDLLQPCRELLDGPTAVAWVRVSGTETPGLLSTTRLAEILMGAQQPMADGPAPYAACLLGPGLRRAGASGPSGLVVASRRSLLSSFEWGSLAGGEGRLVSRRLLIAGRPGQGLPRMAASAPTSPAIFPMSDPGPRPPICSPLPLGRAFSATAAQSSSPKANRELLTVEQRIIPAPPVRTVEPLRQVQLVRAAAERLEPHSRNEADSGNAAANSCQASASVDVVAPPPESPILVASASPSRSQSPPKTPPPPSAVLLEVLEKAPDSTQKLLPARPARKAKGKQWKAWTPEREEEEPPPGRPLDSEPPALAKVEVIMQPDSVFGLGKSSWMPAGPSLGLQQSLARAARKDAPLNERKERQFNERSDGDQPRHAQENHSLAFVQKMSSEHPVRASTSQSSSASAFARHALPHGDEECFEDAQEQPAIIDDELADAIGEECRDHTRAGDDPLHDLFKHPTDSADVQTRDAANEVHDANGADYAACEDHEHNDDVAELADQGACAAETREPEETQTEQEAVEQVEEQEQKHKQEQARGEQDEGDSPLAQSDCLEEWEARGKRKKGLKNKQVLSQSLPASDSGTNVEAECKPAKLEETKSQRQQRKEFRQQKQTKKLPSIELLGQDSNNESDRKQFEAKEEAEEKPEETASQLTVQASHQDRGLRAATEQVSEVLEKADGDEVLITSVGTAARRRAKQSSLAEVVAVFATSAAADATEVGNSDLGSGAMTSSGSREGCGNDIEQAAGDARLGKCLGSRRSRRGKTCTGPEVEITAVQCSIDAADSTLDKSEMLLEAVIYIQVAVSPADDDSCLRVVGNRSKRQSRRGQPRGREQ